MPQVELAPQAPGSVVFWHTCGTELLPAVLPTHDGGWTVTSWHPLSVMPSILCRACGCHGYWTDGEWKPC